MTCRSASTSATEIESQLIDNRPEAAENECAKIIADSGIGELDGHPIGDGATRLRALIHNASDWLPDSAELSPEDILRRMMQVHVAAPRQRQQVAQLGEKPARPFARAARPTVVALPCEGWRKRAACLGNQAHPRHNEG